LYIGQEDEDWLVFAVSDTNVSVRIIDLPGTLSGLELNFSSGVSKWSEGAARNELLDEADREMYGAKAHHTPGRRGGSAVIYGSEIPSAVFFMLMRMLRQPLLLVG
jgi:hypothetical protein